jgi:hypothetical protein
MSDLKSLFGTDSKPVAGKQIRTGRTGFTFENGAIRHLKLDGVEAIRSIAFLVRDRDWGTLEPEISDETHATEGDSLRIDYRARFHSHGATLDVKITIHASGDGLVMRASGTSDGAFETNRAGFTVLHPINGVAGHPVTVEHSDGSVEDSEFPELIEPWQPFKNIAAISHGVSDQTVTCRFSGDTFEMEDQRQWGDASFKTYNRPLALPWPYLIADGSGLEQSVELTWSHNPKPAIQSDVSTAGDAFFPETAIVISPDDAARLAANPHDLRLVQPQRLLCHLDATLGNTETQFTAFRKTQNAFPGVTYDLELICGFEKPPEIELGRLADEMKASGFDPDSILVCPSVDRGSTPPGSDWPDCPPLELIHTATDKAFEGILHGGGMVSFFPELNRKRPPVDQLHFVSHGLCPIVHAADDFSVMETLETIPHITRSARKIIGNCSYRIGPATIAMRQNPYGERTIPNPNLERVCMTDDDPRHRAQFGAAYVIGLATALAPAGISVWTPSGLYGPRGLIGTSRTWPLAKPLHILSGLANQRVRQAEISGGIARLQVGNTTLRANLTPCKLQGLPPYGWEHEVLSA